MPLGFVILRLGSLLDGRELCIMATMNVELTSHRYYFKYIIITPAQLTAAALVIKYWNQDLNPGIFITVFLVAIVAINWFGIRFFGEFEFWLSTLKVIVICGVILLSLILALGGGPDHDRKGFRYWKNPGAFNEVCCQSQAEICKLLTDLSVYR